MKKKYLILLCAVCVVIAAAVIITMTANRGDVSNVNRVTGYSALYGEEQFDEVFDLIEKTFAKEYKGCTLLELRYDSEVENKYGEEFGEYLEKYNRELMVVLSTFETDEKGGDGGFNPNDTYTNWQWYVLRTEDMKGWETISCGY